jgi:hypothetical protein
MLKRSRASAAVVALGLAVAGVGLSAAPAHAAALGSCEVTTAGLVYTLTADCSVTTAIDIPDGVTLDGAGYTITAVETPGVWYHGETVLRSAVGDDSAAAVMNVKNLHIETNFTLGGNSGGLLSGIYMIRAGGTIENVSVDGMSHGNGVQEGRGIYIKNLAPAGSPAYPEAVVSISDTSITRFQKSGLYLSGNVKFDLKGLTIGRGAGPNGEANDGIAANGLTILNGARGSLTDSQVAPNYYKLPADTSATGILVMDSGKVTLARNIVSSAKGNVGVYVYGQASDVTLSCTLVRVTGTQTPNSFGVVGEDAPNFVVRDSSISGFETGAEGVTPTTGNGDCLAPAPKVKAYPGDHAVDVVWTRAAAPTYAPVTAQVVVLTTAGEADRTLALGATDDSATFTGLTGGASYTAVVRVVNASGNATASASARLTADPVVPTAVAVKQAITLSRNHTKVTKGHSVVFKGRMTPARPGVTVEIVTRSTGHWVVLGTTVIKADGTFSFKWKATKPYGTHHFKVRSAATSLFLAGITPCRDVKVKKA